MTDKQTVDVLADAIRNDRREHLMKPVRVKWHDSTRTTGWRPVAEAMTELNQPDFTVHRHPSSPQTLRAKGAHDDPAQR